MAVKPRPFLWDASCLGVSFNDSSSDTASLTWTPSTHKIAEELRVQKVLSGLPDESWKAFQTLAVWQERWHWFYQISSDLLTSAFPAATFPLSREAVTYDNGG